MRSDLITTWCWTLAASPSGLAAEELEHAGAARERADGEHLGKFEHEGESQREQPELLGRDPADQRRQPVFGDVVGRGVEILVTLAGIVVEVGEQLARHRLVT